MEREVVSPYCNIHNANVNRFLVSSLLLWGNDKHEICETIRAHKSKLKFILKTKDERFFIKEWFEYYSSIVNPEDIIIFDNMSSDLIVTDFYKTICDSCQIIRYDGFHNYLHVTEMFPELYKALSDSCEYFCILDSDEFIILLSNGNAVNKLDIPYFIHENCSPALPCTWISNGLRSKKLFKCGTDSTTLQGGLAWGKPVIKANWELPKIVLHNSQLGKIFYTKSTPTNLFLLHLTDLYPEQRIRANIAKLIARKFVKPEESLEAILAKSTDGISDSSIGLYLNEIRRLITVPKNVSTEMYPGTMELILDNDIRYFSQTERCIVSDFLAEGSRYLL